MTWKTLEPASHARALVLSAPLYPLALRRLLCLHCYLSSTMTWRSPSQNPQPHQLASPWHCGHQHSSMELAQRICW